VITVVKKSDFAIYCCCGSEVAGKLAKSLDEEFRDIYFNA
jgi:hypothetical protein